MKNTATNLPAGQAGDPRHKVTLNELNKFRAFVIGFA